MPTPLEAQHLSHLIGRIYDCAVQPSHWAETLHQLTALLNARVAYLRLDDLTSRTTVIARSAGIPPVWLERQPALAPEVIDILVGVLGAGQSIDAPSVATRHMSREAIDATTYSREWGRPQGLADYMMLFLLHTPTRLAGLEFGRHEEAGDFGTEEIELARLLIPHLRRCMIISNALDAVTIEKERLAKTLDTLRVGVVLTDGGSRILHANTSASAMFRRGGPVRHAGGRLHAEDEAATTEIRAAIETAARDECAMGKSGLAVRLGRRDTAPLVAHVLPLAKGEVRARLDPKAVAAVFVSNGSDDEGRVTAASVAFGLTAAETRVLSRILHGCNVVETADALGVAVSTVRTHLDNIFAKTGVSRQADLVRLVARIVPTTL